MLGRVKKHLGILQYLCKCPSKSCQFKALMKHADKDLVRCLCECIQNVTLGNVKIGRQRRKMLAQQQPQPPYYPPPAQQQLQQQQQPLPIGDLTPIRVWVQPPGRIPNQQAHHQRVVRHRCPLCDFESGRAADCIDHIGQVHKAGETHLCPGPGCGHWARNRSSLFSHTNAIHKSTVKWRQNRPIGLQPIKRRRPARIPESEDEDGDN